MTTSFKVVQQLYVM